MVTGLIAAISSSSNFLLFPDPELFPRTAKMTQPRSHSFKTFFFVLPSIHSGAFGFDVIDCFFCCRANIFSNSFGDTRTTCFEMQSWNSSHPFCVKRNSQLLSSDWLLSIPLCTGCRSNAHKPHARIRSFCSWLFRLHLSRIDFAPLERQ